MTRTKITTIFAISFVLILLFFLSSPIHLVEKNNTSISEPVTKNHTPYIDEYDLPVGSSPNGITADKKGFVWIVGSDSTLYKFDSKLDKMDSVYFIGDKEFKPKGSIMGWAIIQDNDEMI